MSKILKIILILAVLGIAGFFGTKWYLRSVPARDVTREQGIELTTDQLLTAYTTNEQLADSLYTNKAIQITGEVIKAGKEEGQTSVELKTSDPNVKVNCKFKDDPGTINPGSTITFKGICTGFLMVSIPIIEGVIVKK